MSHNLAQEPVTVVISRRVKPGCETEFEQLSTEMTETAAQFPGYLGANLFRPASKDDPEYRIVFKFRSQAELSQWQEAPKRLALLDKFEDLLIEPSKVEITSGIITWFTLPAQNPVQPPAKWKMTFVSWLALYPTVTLIFFLIADLLAPLPLPLRTMIITAIVMVLMSYVLMPRFTRWFAFWLFPKKRDLR
ncbi:antibiotic biosynthesis monooxygenase [Nitrincola tapanii]|uniref:Antibiotic biosynthesis monooxygenase n=1 Tax=Nitrincola tapanii TaxID=1708751 RepID=A0A5A9W2C9_9GAMM|nr:antibiotic biosynthesis monooxygenase [Nitrincola tapanii]KAA0874950.1 antibiotic biosynthesis monooxygenase [Nitrincola tapanii]